MEFGVKKHGLVIAQFLDVYEARKYAKWKGGKESGYEVVQFGYYGEEFQIEI